jgi:hypothetical protein
MNLNVNKISWLIFMVVLPFGINSCTTFPEPTNTKNILVIGQLVENGLNNENYNGATINGKHLSNIELTIINENTKTKTVLKTTSTGQFFSVELEAGEYKVKKIHLKVVNGNSYATSNFIPDSLKYFTIKNDVVNNLGVIEWIADADQGHVYNVNMNYSTIKDNFLKNNPDSIWNSKVWVETTIHK